jgi:hypothetical protein
VTAFLDLFDDPGDERTEIAGIALVITPRSVTTSRSTHLPPALTTSVRMGLYEVTCRSRTASSSTSSDGA